MTEQRKYKYVCEFCKYTSNKRQGYYQHCKTQRHLKSIQKENALECPKCKYIFKHKSSLSRHRKKDCCHDNSTTNNIQNQTNNTNTNSNNTINITFNINSKEEVDMIKSILTTEKIIEICTPSRCGLPMQSYDIVKNIQRLSIESKKNNNELMNFRKTNARDNLIDVYDDDVYKKVHFKKYNLEDIQKFSKIIADRIEKEKIEPDKSYEERIDLICMVIKDYDYYKDLSFDDGKDHTIAFILDALDDCEKESKLAYYNMTVENIKDFENTNDEIIII